MMTLGVPTCRAYPYGSVGALACDAPPLASDSLKLRRIILADYSRDRTNIFDRSELCDDAALSLLHSTLFFGASSGNMIDCEIFQNYPKNIMYDVMISCGKF